MSTNYRPEPGIATDDELRNAAKELANALLDDVCKEVQAERFSDIASDDWSEIIIVRLTDNLQATKETVINDALKSDAPVRLRDLERDDENKLTFYPTNQKE